MTFLEVLRLVVVLMPLIEKLLKSVDDDDWKKDKHEIAKDYLMKQVVPVQYHDAFERLFTEAFKEM